MEDILQLDLSDDELLNTIVPYNKKPAQVGQVRKKERSKIQEKYLDKTVACREILKWKYCYLESNPREYSKFYEYRKKFHAKTRSMHFKKQFRLKMDDEYYSDMLHIKKHIINKELMEMGRDEVDSGIHESVKASKSVKDPVKLLINYDREVAQKAKKIRQNFLVYLQFPKCYPAIAVERELFMKQRNPFKVEKDVEKSELDKEWQLYWSKRITTLCDQAIEKEKEEIRKKWQGLVTRYEDTSAMVEDFDTLVISDDEVDSDGDDDDVIFVGSVHE